MGIVKYLHEIKEQEMIWVKLNISSVSHLND